MVVKMYWNEIKRIASAAGFIVGILTLAVNLFRGHTLLHSTYTALIMMVISSIIFLFCLRGIGNILTTFLMQKKMEADAEKKRRAKEMAKEKLDELKARREQLEGKTRERLQKQAEEFMKENNSNAPNAEDVEEKISA